MGLMESMTAPYLETLGASQHIIGVNFLLAGAAFVTVSPIAGYVCDNDVWKPISVSIAGNLVLCFGLLLVGPASFFPIKPSIWLTIMGCMLIEVGVCSIQISSFSRIFNSALEKDYQDNLSTYMGILGSWQASFYFGNFVGPTIAGFLVNYFGFRMTGFIFAVSCAFMAVVDLVWKAKKRSGQQESLGGRGRLLLVSSCRPPRAT